MRHQIYWATILTTAKHVGFEHYDELKKTIVAYYYQNWIAGATVTRIKQTSFNILNKVKDKNSIDDIKQLIIDNLNKFETTDVYREEIKGEYLYGKNWNKAVLLMLEYSYKDSSNQNFIPLEQQKSY